LKEKYGLNINPINVDSTDWVRFGDHVAIGMWGEKFRRTISWPDNGKQPKNELLLQYSFSVGAYIFGEHYPVELFQKLFQELKTYNPKYVDSHNSALYFSMDNAKDIFNIFDDIMKKYFVLNKEDYKERQIKKLEDELLKLKS
jgi:hypothetical protein